MRLRRRVAFATPFILVACGGSSKPAVEEPDDEEKVVAKQAEPQPPLIDTSHFPTTRDPQPDIACDPHRYDEAKPLCNPPPPARAEQTTTANPPRPLKAPIVSLEVVANASVITIGRGTDDGIDRRWRGCVLDQPDGERCMTGGDFVIIKADERRAIAKVKLTPDQIGRSKMVKLRFE